MKSEHSGGGLDTVGDIDGDARLQTAVQLILRDRTQNIDPDFKDVLDSLESFPKEYRDPIHSLTQGVGAMVREKDEESLAYFIEAESGFRDVSAYGWAVATREIIRCKLQRINQPVDEKLLQETIDVFNRVGDKTMASVALRTMSVLKDSKGDPEGSFAAIEEAMAILPADAPVGIKVDGASLWMGLLVAFGRLEEVEPFIDGLEAEAVATKSVVLTLQITDLRCLNAFWKADYVELILMARTLLDHAASINSVTDAAQANEYLAVAYSLLGDYTSALKHMEQSIEVFERLKKTKRLTYSYGNLGALYFEAEEYEMALINTEKAAAMSWSVSDVVHAGRQEVNRILYMAHLEMIDEVDAILRDLDVEDQVDPSDRLDLYWAVSVHHKNKGDLLRAEQELVKSLEILNANKVEIRRIHIYGALRDVYLAKSDLQNYVKYNELYTTYKDEKAGSDAARRVALVEREYEMKAIDKEREQERAVLYSTLPKHVADRMIKGEQVTDHFDVASVLFLDIVGFTTISDRIPAGHVVHLLKAIFKVCDDVCKKHGITRIKTIGDSYLAVSGVPEPLADHAERAALAALDMMKELNEMQLTMDPSLGDTSWTSEVGEVRVRIGLHSGPIVAGIVGDEQLQYDIWGDTVNVASRMESNSEPGKIHVSEAFANCVGSPPQGSGDDNRDDAFSVVERGSIEIKGKGAMKTFWLEGA